MSSDRRRPLEGLIVVALEQAVAAPFCTARLADAGARVIKIERPEGDFARFYDQATPAGSSYFAWLNRGKESVVLDLASAQGKFALRAMVARADVLVQNFKPGAVARMGFAIEDLRRAHPRLVCCSISGYGETGPLADRKAYDLLVQAEVGLAAITGGPAEPARVGISVADIATGATAHAAILEALIARGIAGEGAALQVSLFDTMADWMAVPLLNAEAGRPPKRVGLAHPSIAPYGAFATKDGRAVLISIQNEREWRALCADVLGDADLAVDPRFATLVERVANRPETDAAVATALGELDAAEAAARLDAAGIAFAMVNEVADLARHPHLRRIEVASAAGPVRLPAPAPIAEGAPREYGAIPALGADTERVLAEFAPEVLS